MNSPLVFGDIFILNEQEFIFLGKTSDILYVARILDLETSKEVERTFLKKIVRNKRTDGTLFCFTKLETNNLKGRVASLTQPIMSAGIQYKKTNLRISEKDKNNLADEIFNSRGVPLGLKELFSS